MALDATEARWVYLFTGGKVKLPDDLAGDRDDVEALQDELEIRQAREATEEQALKEVLLAQSIAKIEKGKEKIRETQAFDVTSGDDKGKEKTETTRHKQGRQELAFEAQESNKVTKIGGKDVKKAESGESLTKAINALTPLVNEQEKLAAVTTKRSRIDAKAKAIVEVTEPLFSDKEIMDELYTPLVRELVLAETFVPPRYSATQQMIDGSDNCYIQACREKGKALGTGGAELAKGAIQLASSVTTTILTALGPVSTGQIGMDHSNTLDKEQLARATDITNGIAAVLTGTVDVTDKLIDTYRGGDFPEDLFATTLKTVGVAIGQMVAGATGNKGLGLTISDSIAAGASGVKIATAIGKWAKDPTGDPPWDTIISEVGNAISSSYSATSDQTSGDESTAWANAASIIGTSYAALARASKQNLITCIRKGQWDAVFDFLAETGTDVGKMIPSVVKFNAQYNATPGDTPQDQIAAQDKLLKAIETFQGGVDKGAGGAEALMKELGKSVGGKLPLTPAENLTEEMQAIFAERQKKINAEKEEAQLKDIGKIEERLKKQKEEYQESLICLGSTNPDDSQYKSIAKLIEQLERDRAIWNGMMALFGGGIGAASGLTLAMTVAAEAAPALKAAGQLVQFIANLKAASDRLAAWLDWREAQKDSISAVSPYATAIDNFASNQSEQFSHYTLQAAANAIQALLACGEMSPYAPAFKAAGAAVGAAAAAENLIYKFYKQQALKKAWEDTKQALDPKNRGNRKMALLVRQVNPTLAKYTIAYGAMIAKDPIAITALNRIGLDRETLARAKDKVNDVRNYMDKLYSDDGTVLGMLPLDAPKSKVKVPEPSLTVRAWSLSCVLWEKNDGMEGDSPPAITAGFVTVEKLLAKGTDDLVDKELDKLGMALVKLASALRSFSPEKSDGEPCGPAKAVAQLYADLAEAKAESLALEHGAEAGNTGTSN